MNKKEIVLRTKRKILKDSTFRKVIDRIVFYFPNSYLVGGFIRDVALDKDSRNLDIVAQFSLKKMKEFVSSINGAKFFTLDDTRNIFRMILKDNNKITTIDFSLYDVAKISDELRNRDFTINSIAIPMDVFTECYHEPFVIIDPFEGSRDLIKKRLRLVSENALKEDPVRILRAFRFKLSHDLLIPEKLKQRIMLDSNMLRLVSGERIAEEILKIFSYKNISSALKEMQKLNVLKHIFLSIEENIGIPQYGYHSEDVFGHLLKCVDKIDNIDKFIKIYLTDYSKQIFSHLNKPIQGDYKRFTFLKLATFLHDIGKSETKVVDKNGRIKFYNHQKVGAEKTEIICKNLRFSKKATNYLVKVVKKHMRIPNLLGLEEITDRATHKLIREAGDELIDLILLCYIDSIADPGPLVEVDFEKKMVKYFKKLLYLKDEIKRQVKEPLIRGDEIINKFGLTPGPEIGEILKFVEKERALGNISTKNNALKKIKERLK